MDPVAIVNGVYVYSTKDVKNIRNTKITFTDHSWCDVVTKEVVNNGPDSISLGFPGKDSTATGKRKQVGPQTFVGNAVVIMGICADVEIVVGKELTISVEGIESEVDAIKFTQLKDHLIVYTTTSANRRSSGIYTTKVTITVPLGGEVRTHDVEGKVTIGDTEGPVHATVSGASELLIGKISDARLSLNGSGSITAASVVGNLTVNLQGSGNVTVIRSTVLNLSVNAAGSGNVRIRGKVENALLVVMGSGKIFVNHVTNEPLTSVMGSGDINVGNW